MLYLLLTRMMGFASASHEKMKPPIFFMWSMHQKTEPSCSLNHPASLPHSHHVWVARCQIIPMSMRLMWSSSSSVTGSWLNCSNNLLFTIFRIDPSILHMDMHSSVTLPQGLSTPVLSARKNRAVSPCFSIWTTFRTAPDGANICSDAKVRLLIFVDSCRERISICEHTLWMQGVNLKLASLLQSWSHAQVLERWPVQTAVT